MTVVLELNDRTFVLTSCRSCGVSLTSSNFEWASPVRALCKGCAAERTAPAVAS